MTESIVESAVSPIHDPGPYVPPAIRRLGTIAELTQGNGEGGTDAIALGGSAIQ